MSIADKIKSRRIELGMTQAELAAKVGLQHAAIYKYESGRVINLKQDKIGLLAAALECSPSWLMCLDDAQQDIFSIPNILPLPKMRKVPRLGTIACGEPILASENIEDYDFVPENIHCDFTLRCRGDSMMNARIFDGDIVYIHTQPAVEHGEIAAILIGEEATLKRVELYEDHIALKPENPMYKPIVLWGEEMNDVRILGKAVYFTSLVR